MCSTFSFMYHGNLLQHDLKIENGLEIIKTCYIASAYKFCKPLILLIILIIGNQRLYPSK